jgi:hypothetical protein
MKPTFRAAGPNALQNQGDLSGNIAGFWLGLWHGLTAPFTFIISLFKDDIGIYEAHNNGRWYNFGFIFGLMIVLGGNKGAQMKFDGWEEE